MHNRLAFLCVWCVLAPSIACAQKLAATHEQWRVFTVNQGGKTLCYMASLPSKKEGNYKKRGEPYLLVTHRSGTHDEVSVSSGYPYKEKSEVTFAFGQKTHKLFTQKELAWAYDTAADKAIVKDMIRSSTLVVRGTSWKGTASKDTYSLKGFTDAHRDMKKLCQ